MRRGFFRRRRQTWDARWRDENGPPAWLEDGPRRQVRSAREEGWIPPGSSVIDLGCGIGNTAAWLASLGHRVLGVDVSGVAIERGRRLFPEIAGLELEQGDVGATLTATGPFDVVLDLGCLHQLPRAAHRCFGENVQRLTSPGSRFLSLARIWNPGETPEAKASMVQGILGTSFELERAEPTEMQAAQVGKLRPGVELRFVRRGV